MTLLFFWKNVSSLAIIRNMFFDHRSPPHPEVCIFCCYCLGGSKTERLNNLWEKSAPPFVWKEYHHRPILGIYSLTRGLLETRKWVTGSKTVRFAICMKKTDPFVFLKLLHRRLIIGMHSLTRGLPISRMWVLIFFFYVGGGLVVQNCEF